VKAAGGDSGCGGIAPSNYDGNYGTYYAGAIYAAQAALLSEQTLNQGSMNAIIILGDGNSDAPNSSGSPDSASPSMSSTTAQITETYSATAPGNQASGSYTYPTATYPLANDSGTYPSWVGECGQAVAAASYASTYSGNKTEVFTVAYGSSTQSNRNNCNTDVNDGLTYSNISPCTTMKDMASEPDYFFSDYSVNGGDTGCQAPSGNNGSLNGIFETILAKLSGVRLIPDNTP